MYFAESKRQDSCRGNRNAHEIISENPQTNAKEDPLRNEKVAKHIHVEENKEPPTDRSQKSPPFVIITDEMDEGTYQNLTFARKRRSIQDQVPTQVETQNEEAEKSISKSTKRPKSKKKKKKIQSSSSETHLAVNSNLSKFTYKHNKCRNGLHNYIKNLH